MSTINEDIVCILKRHGTESDIFPCLGHVGEVTEVIFVEGE
jgi:hypothetical protein